MATEVSERYGDDVFSQSRHDETDRLGAICDTYDPVSRQRIRALGLPANARCLDVGAGPGSISAWLADEFPDGEVTAADRDARLLVPLSRRHPNMTAVEVDFSAPEAADGLGVFDLVHVRFVLMHLRDRLDVLGRLAALVAPGGWIVISDSVDLTTATAAHAPYRQVMAAMWTLLQETIGTDITSVQHTPALLREAGYSDVGVEVYLPSADHRAPVARFWRLTWAQLKDRMLDRELVDPRTFDLALRALSDPRFTDLSPGMITTYGRRPNVPQQPC
jgi:2-polyprenyl-3-methyl-5-hydroxy-6-metoxy-1,4-benzoquinol methylase